MARDDSACPALLHGPHQCKACEKQSRDYPVLVDVRIDGFYTPMEAREAGRYRAPPRQWLHDLEERQLDIYLTKPGML